MKATILIGDVLNRLAELPDGSVRTCVTSPPYWGLRDYGEADQLGLEPTPEAYVENMVKVFREVWRVLADDGTLWLNLGDSYTPTGNGSTKKGLNERYFGRKFASDKQGSDEGHVDRSKFIVDTKPKDLVGIPWRVAFALQADGWYLRQDIIWAKPNVMPESVRDRCTKSHEYVFLLSKRPKYYYDHEAIKEPVSEVSLARSKYGFKTNRESAKAGPNGIDVEEMGERFVSTTGRNKRDVWFIATARFKGAHFAVMPEALVEPCVLAGSAEGDTVLDPFTGSGTVAVVALRHGRNFVGTELNAEYAEIARERIANANPMFNEIEVK
jgi:DNA modification methylase